MQVQDFVAELQRHKRRLFHFTDERNIASIKAAGLLTTRTITQFGIATVTGGDSASLQIDQQKGLDAYISLSFCRSHPMSHVAREEGRIQTIRILTVCPSVLLWEGVLIADQVATANAAIIGRADEMIPKMDLVATYQRLDWGTQEGQSRRNAAEKWEALIPKGIHPSLLFGL